MSILNFRTKYIKIKPLIFGWKAKTSACLLLSAFNKESQDWWMKYLELPGITCPHFTCSVRSRRLSSSQQIQAFVFS